MQEEGKENIPRRLDPAQRTNDSKARVGILGKNLTNRGDRAWLGLEAKAQVVTAVAVRKGASQLVQGWHGALAAFDAALCGVHHPQGLAWELQAQGAIALRRVVDDQDTVVPEAW